MGTTQSRTSSEREWKGPFSDEEYECLVAKYKAIAAGGSVSAAQGQLQTMLSLAQNEQLPAEWRDGLSTMGASFYELCLYAREYNGSTVTGPALQLVDFVQGVALVVRGSSQSIARGLFRLFLKDKKSVFLDELSAHQLLLACLIMADERVAEHEPHHLVSMTRALADAALPPAQPGQSRQLSMDDFLRWTSAQMPLLYTVFTSWLSTRFFGDIARPAYTPPTLSHKSEILSQSQSIALSLTCTPLQRSVDRLYTNAQDGLSFNRLCHHILGYGGPTLVVIRDTDGDIFGMYCDTEWREATKFYGSNACFLFRLEPYFNVYRTSANDTANYMYLNTKGVALPRGIGMGGDTNSFRLFLNEDFDDSCYTTPKCLSFEPGRLTTRNQFSVEAVEVWGCGGVDSTQRQREYRKDTAAMIDKMRKVDKAAFMGSEFDRNFLLSKTFGHGTDQARIVEDQS